MTLDVTGYVMGAGHLHPIPPEPLIQVCFQNQQLSHSYHRMEHVSNRQVLVPPDLWPAPCCPSLLVVACVVALFLSHQDCQMFCQLHFCAALIHGYVRQGVVLDCAIVVFPPVPGAFCAADDLQSF